MREIKVRAWDKKREKMLLPESLRKLFLNCDGGMFCGDCDEWGDVYDNELIFLEYTGIKDKKRTKEYPEGQEICEGDIVKVNCYNFRTKENDWRNSEVIYKGSGFHLNLPQGDIGWLDSFGEIHGLKVIGNIFENKSLLKA